MNPILSIVTVNRNYAEGLERTIRSIVSQTFRDIEYLVIDGDSVDSSKAVLEKYRDGITFSVSEPDRGIYHAMNKGIEKAKGDYLLFINSGDELSGAGILEQVVPMLRGEDIIACDLILVSGKGEEIRKYPDKPSFRHFLTDSLPHPATFIRRALLEKTNGYDESLKIVSDWAFFMIALFRLGATYRHLPIALSRFYMDGISSTIENRALIFEERDKVISKHFSTLEELIREWRAGENYRFVFENSRLIKLARRVGFLKHPDERNG